MAYSLGLTLYALANRQAELPEPMWAERPGGRLVWLHAPSASHARSLIELGHRLGADTGIAVLLTCPDPVAGAKGLLACPPPPDTGAAAKAFLDHWKPDVAVWSEGALRPALLHEAHLRAIPLLLVDAVSPHIVGPRGGWWPGLIRGVLAQFRHVLTVDEPASRAFRRAGATVASVETRGRMEESSGALPCNEAERASLALGLKSRPVWLAASLPQDEEEAVIEAHRLALRLAHRLLLLVVPQDPARTEPLAQRMAESQGWIVARRAAEEDLDDDVQVYLADSEAEFGLWYRLSPITYIGGTLSESGALRDPFEPAALGSAIIHGPRHGGYHDTFARLHAANATRVISSGSELGTTVSDLLAPDRAARLAHAAWSVSSSGAEVTDRVLSLIRRLLPEGGH
jgi:3-deoxy-D-manno-octulosonic-acid transferase